MGRMTYIQRRANRYEFRYRLPDDLAGKALPTRLPSSFNRIVNASAGRFKREIIKSLGTNDLATANRKVLSHIAEAQGLIDQLRRFIQVGPERTITSEQINALVMAHERNALVEDEERRRLGIGFQKGYRLEKPNGHGMSEEDMDIYRFIIDFEDGERRKALARMQPDWLIKRSVEKALHSQGIRLEADDPARRELELKFLQADRRAIDLIKARLAGEVIPTPEAAGENAAIGMREAFRRWSEEGGRGAKRPRSGTVLEARKALDRFIELHGDLPVTSVSKAHARAFRDTLIKVPKALPGKLAKLPLPELLNCDLSGFPQRSAQTVNKSLNLLGGVLARAERDGFFDALPGWTNPFRVTLEIAASEKEPYEPFTVEELNLLFSSPVFNLGARPKGGRGEAAYWFPLIALFSGARRTEIAQLKVRDVRQSEDGICFFDLTGAHEDQHVKNVSSARWTPVHPQLIALGLLKYVSQRARTSEEHAPLWPAFEPPVDPKAKAWTKWFGRYLGEHVTEDPAKTFHSFRHTFKRACREAGLGEEIHNALTGHSGGGVGRSYGRERLDSGGLDRGISLERLQAELQRVGYPKLDLAKCT